MSTNPTATGLWEYRSRVERIVDGDTLDLTIDLGFGVRLSGDDARVRLDGVDTAETYGVRHDSDEYAEGKRHTAFVEDWVAEARESDAEWPFLVKTFKDDERGKYGRFIARIVRRSDSECLNDALIREFPGVARSY